MKYKSILILIFTFISVEIFSQNFSPYTRFGIGDILYTYSARSLGMGQSGSALTNGDFVSISNPASWAGLNETRIEFSYALGFSKLITNEDSRTYRDGAFKGFTFAFPVSKRYGIGLAIGLVPYSRLHYKTQRLIQNDSLYTDPYIQNLIGEGGLSKIFIGTSYKLPFDLLIGATFDYYFGNLEYTSELIFPENNQNPAEYKLMYSPIGIGTTIGLISPDMSSLFNSESVSNLRIGAALNLVPDMDTDTLLTTKSGAFLDTVSEGKTTMRIPNRFTFGSSITFSKEYIVNVDYTFQLWENFKFTPVNEQNLRNAQRISAGFEFRPEHKLGITFWEQIMWRFGLSYEQTQYRIMNNDLQQYSVSGGFSLPISPQNSLDIGIEYAVRGTKNSGLISENILRINLGLSFGDIWFIRYEK